MNELVGGYTAGYDGHRGGLYAAAVVEEHRRNGTGARLVAKAMAALDALGCTKINLHIRSSNRQVVVFHESLGFRTEDRLSIGLLL